MFYQVTGRETQPQVCEGTRNLNNRKRPSVALQASDKLSIDKNLKLKTEPHKLIQRRTKTKILESQNILRKKL